MHNPVGALQIMMVVIMLLKTIISNACRSALLRLLNTSKPRRRAFVLPGNSAEKKADLKTGNATDPFFFIKQKNTSNFEMH